MAPCTVQWWAMCWSNEDKAGSQAVWKVLIDSHHYVFNQYILLETACDYTLADNDTLKQGKLQNLKLAF